MESIVLFGSHRIASFGRGDGAVGNPHRAQISQFELFELKYIWIRVFRAYILLLKLDEQFPVEQFERGNSISVNSILPPS